MNTAVRMQDIAQRAGVAKSTVSMALREDPSLPLSTRLRIQTLAREMGYRPNPMISALMATRRSGAPTKRQVTLGFVSAFPIAKAEKILPTFRRFRRGISDQARKLGFRLADFEFGPDKATPQRLSAIMRARGIPGFILPPLPAAVASLDFDWNAFATVAIGYTIASPLLHRSAHHQYHGMATAVDRLTELGYSRIGVAMDLQQDQNSEHNWLAAFLVRWFAKGCPSPTRALISADWKEKVFREWFLRERPDAVVSYRPEVRVWLENLGARVPDDVGFVSLDWSVDLGDCAGIDQKSELVAAAALDLLVEQLYQNQRGIPLTPKAVLIEGEWVRGSTVRAQ